MHCIQPLFYLNYLSVLLPGMSLPVIKSSMSSYVSAPKSIALSHRFLSSLASWYASF